MSLGNYPFELTSGDVAKPDREGLNNAITKYATEVISGVGTFTGGTLNYGVLTTGTVKILFGYVTGLSASGSGTASDNISDETTLAYTTNAVSYVKPKAAFPDNSESGIDASGLIVPYTGSETATDDTLTLYAANNVVPNETSTWIMEYTSGTIPVVHTQTLASNMPDEDGAIEQGLQEGIRGGLPLEFDNTYDASEKDILVYDDETNKHLWLPEDALDAGEDVVDNIQQEQNIILPFGFECGAIVIEAYSASSNVSVRVKWNSTSKRYDTIEYQAGAAFTNQTLSFIIIGV